MRDNISARRELRGQLAVASCPGEVEPDGVYRILVDVYGLRPATGDVQREAELAAAEPVGPVG